MTATSTHGRRWRRATLADTYPALLAAQPDQALLRPWEVGRLLHVTAKTVVHWADQGKLTRVRTLGGHSRIPAAQVLKLAGDAGELLTSAEAAELLRVSRRTVNTWTTAGQLPSIRLPSGHYRIPADAVHALVAERARPKHPAGSDPEAGPAREPAR